MSTVKVDGMAAIGSTSFGTGIGTTHCADDSNIIEYFQTLLIQLEDILLCKFDDILLEDIALQIHATEGLGDKWGHYAEAFGLSEVQKLQVVKYKAEKLYQKPPLYIALTGPLKNNTVDKLIGTLIKYDRKDILVSIKGNVEKFLKKHKKMQNATGVEDTFDSGLGFEDNFVPFNSSVGETPAAAENCLNANADELDRTAASQPGVCQESLQCSSKMNYNHKEYFSSPEPLRLSKSDPITAFVVHVHERRKEAKKFVSSLRSTYRFAAVTFSEAKHLIATDYDLIKDLLYKVDFIIPLISEEYFRSIACSGNIHDYSDDANNNRFIYTLMQSEYVMNHCQNFRVRPVLVKGFDRRKLKLHAARHPVLRWVYQLWDEVPDLVEHLYETRELRQNMNEIGWNREDFVDICICNLTGKQ